MRAWAGAPAALGLLLGAAAAPALVHGALPASIVVP